MLWRHVGGHKEAGPRRCGARRVVHQGHQPRACQHHVLRHLYHFDVSLTMLATHMQLAVLQALKLTPPLTACSTSMREEGNNLSRATHFCNQAPATRDEHLCRVQSASSPPAVRVQDGTQCNTGHHRTVRQTETLPVLCFYAPDTDLPVIHRRLCLRQAFCHDAVRRGRCRCRCSPLWRVTRLAALRIYSSIRLQSADQAQSKLRCLTDQVQVSENAAGLSATAGSQCDFGIDSKDGADRNATCFKLSDGKDRPV